MEIMTKEVPNHFVIVVNPTRITRTRVILSDNCIMNKGTKESIC